MSPRDGGFSRNTGVRISFGFQREFGRTHDVQGQARLRAELAERIEAVLSEHEMRQEEYDRITAVISVDQAHRERFEALLELLLGGAGAG